MSTSEHISILTFLYQPGIEMDEIDWHWWEGLYHRTSILMSLPNSNWSYFLFQCTSYKPMPTNDKRRWYMLDIIEPKSFSNIYKNFNFSSKLPNMTRLTIIRIHKAPEKVFSSVETAVFLKCKECNILA